MLRQGENKGIFSNYGRDEANLGEKYALVSARKNREDRGLSFKVERSVKNRMF